MTINARSILFVELKGFSAMAVPLARDLESIGVNTHRVRATTIHVFEQVLANVRGEFSPLKHAHVVGDTWYAQFDDLDLAARFGVRLMQRTYELVTSQGQFYLKPAVAIAFGDVQLREGSFLDDESVATFKASDSGRPFSLQVLGTAATWITKLDWIETYPLDKEAQGASPAATLRVDWMRSKLPSAEPVDWTQEVSVPALLLDSEIIVSESAPDALNQIIREQSRSRTIRAFGGPVPLGATPYYNNYIEATLSLLYDPNGPRLRIISYIPVNEARDSLAWIELCRQLQKDKPDRFSFAAFPIGQGSLRPFSYQVFDNDTVHIGLREYLFERDKTTMNSAILVRNSKVAQRFAAEFAESWRYIGKLNDSTYQALAGKLLGLDDQMRKEASDQVQALLSDFRDAEI